MKFVNVWIQSCCASQTQEEEGEGELQLPQQQSTSCLGPMGTQGSTVPGEGLKVRGQPGPWLKYTGGPSSPPLASDPDSDIQNLVPT